MVFHKRADLFGEEMQNHSRSANLILKIWLSRGLDFWGYLADRDLTDRIKFSTLFET